MRGRELAGWFLSCEEEGGTAAPHRGCPQGKLPDEVATQDETWFCSFCCSHSRDPPVRRGSSWWHGDRGRLFCTGCALGGAGQVAEINVWASTEDVDDSFYQFHTLQLASWLAESQLVDPAEIRVTQIWSEHLDRFRPVQPGKRCYVGFARLPMGWSRALHFCHTAVSHIARCLKNIAAGAVIQERRPAPHVCPGDPALGIYVDNVYSIGCQVGDSLRLVAGFVKESRCRSLRVHWECQDAEEATILGVEIWGPSCPHRQWWHTTI